MPVLGTERLEDRVTPAARLQFLNDLFSSNDVFSGTTICDVYVNDVKVADNLGAATPYLDVPSGTPVKIDVVPDHDPDNKTPRVSKTVTFADGSVNLAEVNGLTITAVAAETAAAGRVSLQFLDGLYDVDAIDVKVRGHGTVANDLALGQFAPTLLDLPAGKYTVDVTRADGVTPLGSFALDLSAAGGKGAVVKVDGDLLGTTHFFGPSISLSAVYSDGTITDGTNSAALLGATFAASGPGEAVVGQAGQVLTSNPTTGTRMAAADAPVLHFNEPTIHAGTNVYVGSGPGSPPTVTVTTPNSTTPTALTVFEDTFTGGVFVATGDVTGDGFPDFVVTPDQGGGGRVRVFDGLSQTVVADFFGIDDPNFRGGARAAIGDVNGDGKGDVIVAAGFGGGPRIAVFDGADLAAGRTPRKLMGDFFAFENTLRNGAFVAAGDVDGDGFADLIFGGGPGGGPRVRVESGKVLLTAGLSQLDAEPIPTLGPPPNQADYPDIDTWFRAEEAYLGYEAEIPYLIAHQPPSAQSTGAELANFFAGDPNGRDGVRVTAKDFDGDGRADVVTGLGTSGDPQVKEYLAVLFPLAGTPTASLELTPLPGTSGEVFVG